MELKDYEKIDKEIKEQYARIKEEETEKETDEEREKRRELIMNLLPLTSLMLTHALNPIKKSETIIKDVKVQEKWRKILRGIIDEPGDEITIKFEKEPNNLIVAKFTRIRNARDSWASKYEWQGIFDSKAIVANKQEDNNDKQQKN